MVIAQVAVRSGVDDDVVARQAPRRPLWPVAPHRGCHRRTAGPRGDRRAANGGYTEDLPESHFSSSRPGNPL